MHLNNKYIRLAFVGADTLTTGRMIPSGTVVHQHIDISLVIVITTWTPNSV